MLRGRLEHRERKARLRAAARVARPLATALLVLMWLPALLGPLLCLLIAVSWMVGTVGMIMIGRARRTEPRPDPRAGEELVVGIGPGDRRTVMVRGRLIGPAHPGDELELEVRPRADGLVLHRGINHSQGGAELRPPFDPWPTALAMMAGWCLLLVLTFPG